MMLINSINCVRLKGEREDMSIKIKVKCVCCDFTKEVGEEQREMPMCDKCFSPMIAEKVIAREV